MVHGVFFFFCASRVCIVTNKSGLNILKRALVDCCFSCRWGPIVQQYPYQHNTYGTYLQRVVVCEALEGAAPLGFLREGVHQVLVVSLSSRENAIITSSQQTNPRWGGTMGHPDKINPCLQTSGQREYQQVGATRTSLQQTQTHDGKDHRAAAACHIRFFLHGKKEAQTEGPPTSVINQERCCNLEPGIVWKRFPNNDDDDDDDV